MGIPALSSSLNIYIEINDENDSPPEFIEEEYIIFIQEDEVEPGQLV